jgi:hypothetical protein
MPSNATPPFPDDPDRPESVGDGRLAGLEEGGLTARRLRAVIRRLESGFYDSLEVRERVARRVRAELQR